MFHTIYIHPLGMSCQSWLQHRTGYNWWPVWTLPVAPLSCDLRRWSQTVVIIKLLQTSAYFYIWCWLYNNYIYWIVIHCNIYFEFCVQSQIWHSAPCDFACYWWKFNGSTTFKWSQSTWLWILDQLSHESQLQNNSECWAEFKEVCNSEYDGWVVLCLLSWAILWHFLIKNVKLMKTINTVCLFVSEKKFSEHLQCLYSLFYNSLELNLFVTFLGVIWVNQTLPVNYFLVLKSKSFENRRRHPQASKSPWVLMLLCDQL